MVKVEINIKERHLLFLILFIGIVAGIGYVIAQLPNPGHPWGQVECVNCVSSGHIDNALESSFTQKCDTSGVCSQVCIGTNCQSSWPSGTDTDCIIIALGEPTPSEYIASKYHGPSRSNNPAPEGCDCVPFPNCPGEINAPSDLWYNEDHCHTIQSCTNCGGFGIATMAYYLNVDYELHCK